MNKLSVIVPVFNEKEAIVDFIPALAKLSENPALLLEIVVIDDHSQDGTAEILAKFDDVLVVRHAKNLGYGASLKTGINNSSGEYICIIDADGSYNIDDIPKLAADLHAFDMVVGARVKNAGSFPLHQKIAKGLVSFLLFVFFRKKIPDINSGLRIFKKSFAREHFQLLPDGFSFTSSITLAALFEKRSIKYTPIDYFKRKGSSKVKVCDYTYNFIKSYMNILKYYAQRKKSISS